MERRRRSLRSPHDTDPMAKVTRRREKPRERWLLTRKTWKYMTDAGRRLIPEGAQNRVEDVPRIEAYFQEVCGKEPHFLLWRKGSYPGALPKPRRKKRPRGGSVYARPPCDEAVAAPMRPTDLHITHVSGGRFDIAKLRRDFFAVPPATPKLAVVPKKHAFGPSSGDPLGGSSSDVRRAPSQAGAGDPSVAAAQAEDGDLAVLLRKYLKIQDERPATPRTSETEELLKALRRYLARQAARDEARHDPRDADGGDASRTTLADALGRYYGRSSDRDHILRDLITDRDLLKKLYQDLRKTKPYKRSSGRDGGAGGAGGSGGAGPAFAAGGYGGAFRGAPRRSDTSANVFAFDKDIDFGRSPPLSPPPLIEVCSEESLEEKKTENVGTQTDPVSDELLAELERAYREKLEAATAPTSPTSPPPVERRTARRRSSVDHDDVSQSVSDTIKRYLRMARKKSVDADKADRFKRINYDKNLRNIKPRPPSEVDDDGPHKGCQTEEGWMSAYRDALALWPSPPTSPPSPASPVSPSQSQSFLTTLLGRGATVSPPAPAGGMQKSRSSSSVVQSVSKRLWRTRSRSSSRVAASWTPQGSCVWADSAGRCVRLADCSLLALAEVERRALQQAALARLQQLNLGITVKIPEENSSAVSSKPKRRTYLLKRKALTTGFFDQTRGKDEKEGAGGGGGGVFGVPLTQCVEAERALRRRRLVGSRASLASLAADDSESCDSGEWGGSWAGVEDSGPKVPALVSACLAHLRRHGLNTLGLFRVSASKKRVRQLREEWEQGQEAALDGAACPHDVATLLKEFLRDLPDPLLCRDLYAAFLQTQKIRSRRLQWEALRLVIQLLPVAHRDTLSALLTFLAQLAMHAPDALQPGNKMDAANLATVFAPNILHRNKPNEPASAEQLSERADVINVVRLLIERQAELWTLPAEMLHEAYIHLAHTEPAHLDSLLQRRAECANERLGTSVSSVAGAVAGEEADHERRVWSREEFLHGGAATGGPDRDVPSRRSEKTYGRSRRTRDTASDTSSGSLSSAMTIVTRVRSSTEECGSSGVMCSAPSATPSARTDSAPDSADSASDYNETLGGSDDDSCIITASLHIPAAFAREAAARPRRPAQQPPPRRRSTSGSESSAKRDSAVGSSSPASASNASSPPASASNTSSPPASPPPAHSHHPHQHSHALRVTVTSTGELKRPGDIDRLISLGRERNTSDARAVVVRQQDESTSPRRPERSRRDIHPAPTAIATATTTAAATTVPSTLYKRGELISSARSPAPPP